MSQSSSERSSQFQEIDIDPQLLKKYDRNDLILYGYPVDFQKCQIHSKANLIYKYTQNNFNIFHQQKQICQCCGRTVGNQPEHSFLYDIKQLAKFGPGITFFFHFSQQIILIIFVYFIIFGIYALSSNLFAHDCQDNRKCFSQSIQMKMSFLNSYDQHDIIMTQIVLILILILIQFPGFLWIRYKTYIETKKYEEALINPSDFSIILRRLPENTNQNDIQLMVQNYRQSLTPIQKIQTNNLKIHKIIFAYDLTNIQKFNKKTQKHSNVVLERIFLLKKQNFQKYHKRYLLLLQYFKNKDQNNYFQVFKIGNKNQKNIFGQLSTSFIFVQTPQPDDIIWQNKGIKMSELLCRRGTVFLFNVVLLMISAVLQYSLACYRITFQQENSQNTWIQQWFSFAEATLITILGYVIEEVFVYTSKFQKVSSHTLLKISLTSKLVLMQFINAGIIPVLVECFIYLPQFRFHKTTVCSDIIFIMTENAFADNFINFCIVYFEIPLLPRRYLLKNYPQKYTQAEANQIFQAYEVEIQNKYVYLYKTLWLSVFFMPIQPSIIFLSLIGLALHYWSQKYLFSGFYTIPEMLSQNITFAVLDLLNFTCLWLILGDFFTHLIRANFIFGDIANEYLIACVVGFLLSLTMIVLPFDKIVKKMMKYKSQLSSYHSYQIQQRNFQLTYQGTNPAYIKSNKKVSK